MDFPIHLQRLVPGRWRLPVNTAMYATALHAARRAADQEYKLVGDLDPASEEFIRAVEVTTGSPHTDGNLWKLLVNGDEIFPSMLAAIRGAQTTLNLLTYVYWSGEIGSVFADAITERARAGVRCNILLDAFGSEKIDHAYIRQMRQAGAQVAWFRPPNWKNITRLDNRTHRKVLVVDGRIGFTGGVGIAPEWTGDGQDPQHWRDTHIRIEGPAVRGLQGAFCENWIEATNEVLAGDAYLPHLPGHPDGVRVQVTRSSAGKGNTNIETLFFLALAAARRRIWLTTAYFSPRKAFSDALIAAAERGVDVRVLLPGPYNNKTVVREAGREDYAELIASKVCIFEFQPTMIHAKTLTVDGVWSSIGSANFDNRSFALNDEVNVSLHDPLLARALDQQFERDLARAIEVTPAVWHHRSPVERVEEAVSSLGRREL